MLSRQKYSGDIQNDILAINKMDRIDFDLMNYGRLMYRPELSEELVAFIEHADSPVFCSDSDVDGISSACVVKEYFPNANFIFGDRNNTRGLTPDIVHQASAFYDADRIITLDCGITNFEGIEEANKLGIKVFVTDHHQPEQILPNAYQIINPQIESYDFKEICGAGVIYAALSSVYGELDSALQWAAMGSICDVMPVLRDNRYIISRGLKSLNTEPNKGLRAVFDAIGIRGNVTEKKIGWFAGPAINAASRMEKTYVAVDAMLNADFDKAKELNQLNNERKSITTKAIETAIIEEHFGVVIATIDVGTVGISGLVASRLVNQYKKPVVVISSFGSYYRGSIRTGDLWSASSLIQESDIIQGGGHVAAAGFSFAKRDKDKAIEYIVDYAKRNTIFDNTAITNYFGDIQIDLLEAVANMDKILAMAPFGQGFRMPTFVSRVTLDSKSWKFTKNNHLSITINGIQAYYYNPPTDIPFDKLVDISYELEYNDFYKVPNIIIGGIKQIGGE